MNCKQTQRFSRGPQNRHSKKNSSNQKYIGNSLFGKTADSTTSTTTLPNLTYSVHSQGAIISPAFREDENTEKPHWNTRYILWLSIHYIWYHNLKSLGYDYTNDSFYEVIIGDQIIIQSMSPKCLKHKKLNQPYIPFKREWLFTM